MVILDDLSSKNGDLLWIKQQKMVVLDDLSSKKWWFWMI